jgi:hypothetical protein
MICSPSFGEVTARADGTFNISEEDLENFIAMGMMLKSCEGELEAMDEAKARIDANFDKLRVTAFELERARILWQMVGVTLGITTGVLLITTILGVFVW